MNRASRRARPAAEAEDCGGGGSAIHDRWGEKFRGGRCQGLVEYDSSAICGALRVPPLAGRIVESRRRSESFIPIAPTRKSAGDGGAQDSLNFDITGERREANSPINDLRREVERWRKHGYERVNPTTRKLLEHWADADRENRVLFCQREAAETAIFLAEVAGRHGYSDWRRRIEEQNDLHNSGLPRVASKMATGTGKTVVMAMLCRHCDHRRPRPVGLRLHCAGASWVDQSSPARVEVQSSAVPRGTTHSVGWPVMAAIRSKSAS